MKGKSITAHITTPPLLGKGERARPLSGRDKARAVEGRALNQYTKKIQEFQHSTREVEKKIKNPASFDVLNFREKVF